MVQPTGTSTIRVFLAPEKPVQQPAKNAAATFFEKHQDLGQWSMRPSNGWHVHPENRMILGTRGKNGLPNALRFWNDRTGRKDQRDHGNSRALGALMVREGAADAKDKAYAIYCDVDRNGNMLNSGIFAIYTLGNRDVKQAHEQKTDDLNALRAEHFDPYQIPGVSEVPQEFARHVQGQDRLPAVGPEKLA
jgi:hypothetical protein